MNKINNFEHIKDVLNFDSADTFYHIQILKRKKENPELGSNSYVVKTYYVSSLKYLEDKMPEIINLCQFNNARAYINLSSRSFEKVAFHTLKKVTDIIMNKDFKSVRKAYESVAGEYGDGKDKKWVIDVDWIDPKIGSSNAERVFVGELIKMVTELQKATKNEPLILELPTKNGMHIITRPFNVQEFKKTYPQLILHKNNPTILYHEW